MSEATYHVIADIEAERFRQIGAEDFSAEHDDQYENGELALAACVYALPLQELNANHSSGFKLWRVLWPWDQEWLKRTDRRRDLVKAAALIIAEIERLDRSGDTNG